MADKLKIARSVTLPLSEISGLCMRRVAGAREIVAVGDEARALVLTPLDAAGALGRPVRRDVGGLLPPRRGGSGWEALDADAAGRVLVLEEAGFLHVLAPDLQSLAGTMTLSIAEGSDLARAWASEDNSRGEGLILLDGGHVLVIKEKRPPRLIEFGPRGARPAGLSPERLRAGQMALPEPPERDLVSLQTWAIDPSDEVDDLSDAAVGPGGTLFVVSDESRCILQLDARLDAAGGLARVLRRWDLPKKVKKPEGLLILDDMSPVVAVDSDDKDEDNLFVLEPLG